MGSPGQSVTNSHARGPERIRSEMRATLILMHPVDEPPVCVVLRDISMDGVGIFHSRDLANGTRLLLQLPCSDGMTLSLRGHVVQSQKLELDRYRIGVHFDVHDSSVLDRLRNALLL